jgi:hypothetical protein
MRPGVFARGAALWQSRGRRVVCVDRHGGKGRLAITARIMLARVGSSPAMTKRGDAGIQEIGDEIFKKETMAHRILGPRVRGDDTRHIS